jgi:hypothetical protein
VEADLNKLRRAEAGAKFVWVFRVKNHDFTTKNGIFSNFRWGAGQIHPPPGSARAYVRVNYTKRCTRLAVACDIKITSCLPMHMVGGSLRLPPSLKTGRHDFAEILLKVALKHHKSINQSNH